jgi:hypothetical protein
MGRSREPPVFVRFGRTNDEAKLRGVAGYMPKRLPSRRWSAYTGTLNLNAEDEYEMGPYRCPKYSSCIN